MASQEDQDNILQGVEEAIAMYIAVKDPLLLACVCCPINPDDYFEHKEQEAKDRAFLEHLVDFLSNPVLEEFQPHLATYPYLQKPIELLASELKAGNVKANQMRKALKRCCFEGFMDIFE